jgi:tetratricopeptide (TPR) repeat protein
MATPSSIRERIPDWFLSLEGPRKLVLNGLILVFSLLGTGVVVKAALKQVYVVEAISVPKDLEANGYTSVTVGQRIIDAVAEINRVAAMTKQVGIYALSEADPSRPDSADFEGPGQAHSASALDAVVLAGDDSPAKYDVSVGGVSLTTMILYVRELFGLSDTKISGEIIAEKPPMTGVVGKDEKPAATKYSIRLRVSDKGVVQHAGEATDRLETLFEDGALKLVERFDPLNAGYYSYYKRDYENALRIARAYLAHGTETDKQWALNLLGMVSHGRFRHDEARAQKGYDDAITNFTELRRSYPQFAPGLYNLGVALIDKGDLLQQQDKDAAYRHYKDARDVALQGIQIEEADRKAGRGSAIGYATAGNALRSMARWEAARYDDALQFFNSSVKANPMFVYAYLSQGNIFYSRRAPEEANSRYQLATEICPSAQTFTRVGALLLHFGQNPDAVPMFQRAAELKPSPHAFTYWGMALRDSGRADEARELFERAIEADPNTPNGYNQFGLMYLEQRKWDAAVEKFTMAIKVSPRWSNYQYNLGLALRGAGKLDQAVSAFERAIAIYPRHAWSYAQLGAMLAEQHQQGVAGGIPSNIEERLTKALEIKPNDAVVLDTIREAYELLNLPERANEFRLRAIAAGENASPGLRADVEQPGRTIEKF